MQEKIEIIDLELKNSLANRFLAEMRDISIQRDSMRFRENLSRIGEIMAYEISQRMTYETKEITTPLGVRAIKLIVDEPVIGTILRAGLPLQEGMLRFFDKADCAYISAFRQYTSKTDFAIKLGYAATPDLENRVLILNDPMLATGASMVAAYREIMSHGQPRKTHIVSVLAAQAGIDYVKEELKDENITIWTAAIDQDLNEKGYIVPGLGDAGDLAYGEKI